MTSRQRFDKDPGELLRAARAQQQKGQFEEMLASCRAALERQPDHVGARLSMAEACLYNGRHDEALEILQGLRPAAQDDARLLQQLGEYLTHAGRHDLALDCYERAATLAPDDSRTRYNLASAQIAVGKLADAEENLSRVIERDPHDYDAWHNRSTLQKQTATNNHIDALQDMLQGKPKHPSGIVALNYALAREYEDLGDYETAFRHLQAGASQRRRMMRYNVSGDVAAMQQLQALHGPQFAQSRKPADTVRGPVFVLGLPRSGTTLVDRILSSHNDVRSLGEINDFALCLMRVAGVTDKQALLKASVAIDLQALGDAYLQSAASHGLDCPLFIDKTPANFLYLGLIARALPGAVVIHVHRHALDSCLAMYRTLFRMGYPFSYDFDDLADYYIAYHRLMQHWRDTFPGLFLDLSYEALVGDQETVTRELLAHCGLEWDDACLAFEKNRQPVATASAAQVRQPLYRDALARWRRYEKQLEPLAKRLEDADIAL